MKLSQKFLIEGLVLGSAAWLNGHIALWQLVLLLAGGYLVFAIVEHFKA